MVLTLVEKNIRIKNQKKLKRKKIKKNTVKTKVANQNNSIDMQLENKSETIDCLFLKIYTNKEKVKKRELFFII